MWENDNLSQLILQQVKQNILLEGILHFTIIRKIKFFDLYLSAERYVYYHLGLCDFTAKWMLKYVINTSLFQYLLILCALIFFTILAFFNTNLFFLKYNRLIRGHPSKYRQKTYTVVLGFLKFVYQFFISKAIPRSTSLTKK